ncbi:hypothetical protein GCK72_006967 [Caenorhabditis remanei]|uniref:Uncharacterized protein n=1 Tax=Caenorhabditis remanei TaxID=31234 RepID=A0A6A5HHZ6_CAERE|nr:hypothetical protein GCK72_006967 [Caenorhabditis remanei]KAF1767009.1 hypothetical protein GCK72_006967 [Caenorhabditis remanei]
MNSNQLNSFFFPSTISPMPQEFPSNGAPAFRNYQVKNSKTLGPRGQYKPRAKKVTITNPPHYRQGRIVEKKEKMDNKIVEENAKLRRELEFTRIENKQLKEHMESINSLEMKMAQMQVAPVSTRTTVALQEPPHVPFSSPPPSVLASPVDQFPFLYHQEPTMMPGPSQCPPPAHYLQFYQEAGCSSWFQPQLSQHLHWNQGFNPVNFQLNQPSTSTQPFLQNHWVQPMEETLDEMEGRIGTSGFSSYEDAKKYLERKFGSDDQLDFDSTGYLFDPNMFSVMKQEMRRPKPRDIHQMSVNNNGEQSSDWELMNAFEKDPWFQKAKKLMERQAREEEVGLIVVLHDGEDEMSFDEYI